MTFVFTQVTPGLLRPELGNLTAGAANLTAAAADGSSSSLQQTAAGEDQPEGDSSDLVPAVLLVPPTPFRSEQRLANSASSITTPVTTSFDKSTTAATQTPNINNHNSSQSMVNTGSSPFATPLSSAQMAEAKRDFAQVQKRIAELSAQLGAEGETVARTEGLSQSLARLEDIKTRLAEAVTTGSITLPPSEQNSGQNSSRTEKQGLGDPSEDEEEKSGAISTQEEEEEEEMEQEEDDEQVEEEEEEDEEDYLKEDTEEENEETGLYNDEDENEVTLRADKTNPDKTLDEVRVSPLSIKSSSVEC